MNLKSVLGERCIVIIIFLSIIFHLFPLFVFGSDIQIIESSGLAAVINAGKSQGIEKGELLSVNRYKDEKWIEITYAEVTHSRRKIARIQVADGAPLMALRVDDIVKPFNWDKKTSESAAKIKEGRTSASTIRFLSLEDEKGLYIGPMVSYFIGVGELRKVMDSRVGYGGILGNRLREDWDISLRFYFAATPQKWTLWDIQILGRKFWDRTFLVDFGYGLTYRAISSMSTVNIFGNPGNLRLAFIVGCGFSIPLTMNSSFEVGGLYHYYPNFYDQPAGFFTLGVRLCL